MKRVLTILAIFIGCGIASARDFEKSLVVYYQTGSAWFLPQLRDNGVRTKAFFNELNQLQSSPDIRITGVELVGSCSPDGTREYNDFLGNRRTMLFYERFSKELNYPISQIVFRNESEDWVGVAKYVAKDQTIARRSEAVSEILKGEPGVIQRIKALDYGRTYQEIYDKIFPLVRTVTVKVTYKRVSCVVPTKVKEEVVVDDYVEVIQNEPAPRVRKTRTPRAPRTEVTRNTPMTYLDASYPLGRMSVKTNAAAWLIGVSNIDLEFAVADNLSLNFPFYYSGWNTNYLTFNFKGLVVQPELRYYLPQVKGFYLGAHAGIAWFNCYGKGEFRYQNINGWKRPAYGGGLNLGYRLPLGKSSPWEVEFGIGAGIYDVAYDSFYKEANGPSVSRNQYTLYYGVDQAQISFVYSFDLGRREGR